MQLEKSFNMHRGNPDSNTADEKLTVAADIVNLLLFIGYIVQRCTTADMTIKQTQLFYHIQNYVGIR